MNKKINIAVLMGGKSSEHEISLMSGSEVVKNLDRKKYNVFPVNISRDGINWQVAGKKNLKFKIENLKFPVRIDLVFITLHGSNGEDGRVQGFLDLIDIPYTGSKVLASALSIDKIYSRKLFTQAGLKVPKTIVVKKSGTIPNLNFDFPVFVKPNNQGSSVGVFKV